MFRSSHHGSIYTGTAGAGRPYNWAVTSTSIFRPNYHSHTTQLDVSLSQVTDTQGAARCTSCQPYTSKPLSR